MLLLSSAAVGASLVIAIVSVLLSESPSTSVTTTAKLSLSATASLWSIAPDKV